MGETSSSRGSGSSGAGGGASSSSSVVVATGGGGGGGGAGGLEDVRWNQQTLRLEKKLAGGDWETVVQFAAFDATVS